jgi:type VI secretion system secreted protein VgrG
MAMNAANSDLNVYLTVTTPLGKDAFEILGLVGDDHISSPFHYTVEMVSSDIDVDFNQILGKSITVNVDRGDGGLLYFNGIVGSLRQLINRDGRFVFTAELRPWFWLLTMVSDCRIFQNLSVPDIIEQIFGDLGFSDFRNGLTGTYNPREYCTQYRETSFDFISRLMEEEGIFYFFEHEDGKHTLVLADDADAHKECPGSGTAGFQKVNAPWADDAGIAEGTLQGRLTISEYKINDYNFETPSTALLVTAAGSGTQSNRSLYDYPGNYLKTDQGEKIAKTRIEAHELAAKSILGRGYCKGFAAGYKFTLEDYDRSDANGTYVLRSVHHVVTQQEYSNTFEAFPVSVPFRPPRITRKPLLPGYQTAVVVGKSGEEIWTDKYGRVKVQFPWDIRGEHDESSSCWIRVAQTWAGKGWGSMVIPRIGMEVLVCFLDGDPDRPLVIGAIYNSQQTVPYTLPDEQTKSTMKSNSSKGGGGFNEIRFEDKKDSEEIFVNAQKDMNVTVGNDQMEHVVHARQVFVQKDAPTLDGSITDGLTVVGNRTVTIKGADTEEKHVNEGKFTQTVTKEFSLTVDGDTLTITATNDIIIKGKSITIETTGGDFKVKSSADVMMEATSNLTDKAGQALTNKAGTDLKNEAGTSLTNKAGTTLENKASVSMTNDGGASLTNKASGTQTVDGGGMLVVKGGMVKIN